jgi:microsomal dipeptidase-like Zn-dependent dipeptidase
MSDSANYYADIHLHPTLKPFLIPEIGTPWRDHDNATAKQRVSRTTERTQSDFSKLFRANVRLVCLNLHLPERYLLSKLLASPRLYQAMFKMDVEILRKLQASQPFAMLEEEIAFMRSHLKDPDSGREGVVARNWKHAQELLQDPDKLCILLCIEGAHCLGFEYDSDDFPTNKRFYRYQIAPAEVVDERLVEERVQWMVHQGVFMLTLCHIAANHMGSQAMAAELRGLMRVLPNPIQSLQPWGEYRGLSYVGQLLVRKCFERGILIDIKHCDSATRRQIYQIAKEYAIPVMGSHVAFSGRKTNLEGLRMRRLFDTAEDRDKAARFNPWDINLHDDDILAIHRSGGLIGLIMDERVLASVKAVKEARKTGKWMQLLYNQIEHAYKVIVEAGEDPRHALDHLCIGSDFDGLIDPIDSVPTVLEFRHDAETNPTDAPRLDTGLLDILSHHRRMFKPTGLEPEEIVAKILRNNVTAFLAKHFKGN